MFQILDTALIQASMAYCANVIGAFFYLFEKVINLITTFFLGISDNWFFYFFIFYFFIFDFLGIYTFYMRVALEDFSGILLSQT